jgi:glycosyltransferase involved in cell wall biosynthesis
MDCYERFDHLGQNRGGIGFHGWGKVSVPGMPVVTVVTVVLNGERHIEKTIRSVLHQTYGNVEYIIVDGGSSDGTVDIIRKYEHAIDYWISEPDEGHFDAMNKGIAFATGEWINFMNAGDSFFESRTLEKLMGSDCQDAELIYGDHVVRYDFGFSRIVNAESLSNLWKGMVFSHQSLLARRRLLEQNTFQIDSLGGDYGFVLSSLERGKKFYYTNVIVSNIEPGGLSDIHRIRSIFGAWQISKKYSTGIRVHLHYFHLLLWQCLIVMIRRFCPTARLIKWRYGHFELKSNNVKVAIISTAPEGGLSSMCRYEHLLEKALLYAGFQVEVHHLSLEQKKIETLYGPFRTLVHHVTVWLTARRVASKLAADIVHIIDGSHGYLVPVFRRFTVVVSVHDLIPVLTQTGKIPGKRPSARAQWIIQSSLKGLKRADCLLPDSTSTMEDLRDVLGISFDAMHVLSPPITNLADRKRVLSRYDVPSPYILHVGHNGAYKNRAGVLEVFSRIKHEKTNSLFLVMAGPAPDDKLRNLVREKDIESQMLWIVGPSDELLSSLYANAELLLFPSLYEGFGWPPLEAMEAGVPVVCSNAASLPEVVGEAALMAPPDDYDELASLCLRVLTEDNLKNELVQKGYENLKRYSFEEFSENLRNVYDSLAPDLKESQRPNGTVSFAVSVDCEK